MSSLQEKIIDFEKAIKNLEEAILVLGDDALMKDGTIKRFEICYDLSWKCLKQKLEDSSVMVFNPRIAFMEGLRAGLTSDQSGWEELIQMRNIAAHSYNPILAKELLDQIPKHLSLFKELLENL